MQRSLPLVPPPSPCPRAALSAKQQLQNSSETHRADACSTEGMSRALCLAGFVVACAAAPPPAAEPIAPATESPTADSKPAPDPGASDVAAPELPGAPPPTDVGWDFHAWSYARELTVTLTSDGCEPAKLGDKPDDTVWCAHHAESKEGAVLFLSLIHI